jgi:hypothetical protein
MHAPFAGITAHMYAFGAMPPDGWAVGAGLSASHDLNGAARIRLLA